MDNNNNNGENHWPEPRKLNDGMITALSEYISKGNYAIVACQLCGIDQSTFYNWLKQGEIDIKNGLTVEQSPYSRLILALKEAESEAENKMVELARSCAVKKQDGYLAITVLERRHPDRWGRRERRQIDITERKEIRITHVDVVLSDGSRGQVIEGESRELLTDGRA